jgi:hypothetical protein
MTDGKLALKYAETEAALAAKRHEYDGYRKALGSDPLLTSWVDGQGRMPKRSLSPFETATVKRMQKLRPEIEQLEEDLTDLFEDVIEGLANRHTDDGVQDPEILLRAALVVMNKRFKAGDSSIELRLVMKATLDFLRSLALDDEEEA